MKLGEATWTQVRDSEPDVALLPVGSTEQHGPHAPLSTDSVLAREVARGADETIGTDRDKKENKDTEPRTLRLPTVPVGVSEEHRNFEGTLHVSPEAFRSYVAETLRSAPADRAVVVNGHGGNIDPLREVCARLTRDDETDTTLVTHWTWWEAVDTDSVETGMGHAGAVETSVLLHLFPELVGEPAEGADSWGKNIEGAPIAYDTDEFSENGVVGDATCADAETGRRLYEEAVGSLVRLVEAVAEI